MSVPIGLLDFDASLEIDDSDITGILTAPETRISGDVFWYSAPLMLALVTACAGISCYVTAAASQTVLSTCVYLSVGHLFDVLLVWLRMGNDYMSQITGTDIKQISTVASNSACKLYPFITGLLSHLSIWLVVCIAIETAIVISKPHRVPKVCQLIQARNIMILLLVLLICVNAHCFWTYRLVKVETSKINAMVCTNVRQGQRSGSDNFRMITWPIVELFVADLCPLATVLACVVTTLRWRSNETRLNARFGARSTHAMQYHSSLRAVCVCFLIVQPVVTACDAFRLSVRAGGVSIVQWTPRLEAQQRMAGVITLLAQQILSVLKPLTLFAVSRSFRRGVSRVICCRKAEEEEMGGTTTPASTDTTPAIKSKRLDSHCGGYNSNARHQHTPHHDDRYSYEKTPPMQLATLKRTQYATTSV